MHQSSFGAFLFKDTSLFASLFPCSKNPEPCVEALTLHKDIVQRGA